MVGDSQWRRLDGAQDKKQPLKNLLFTKEPETAGLED